MTAGCGHISGICRNSPCSQPQFQTPNWVSVLVMPQGNKWSEQFGGMPEVKLACPYRYTRTYGTGKLIHAGSFQQFPYF